MFILLLVLIFFRIFLIFFRLFHLFELFLNVFKFRDFSRFFQPFQMSGHLVASMCVLNFKFGSDLVCDNGRAGQAHWSLVDAYMSLVTDAIKQCLL